MFRKNYERVIKKKKKSILFGIRICRVALFFHNDDDDVASASPTLAPCESVSFTMPVVLCCVSALALLQHQTARISFFRKGCLTTWSS